MILSERGAEFIEREEGYRADAYNDSEGYCTVGVGHLIGYHNCTAADHARWDGMSMPAALRLLAADNAPGLQAIQHYIHVELTQPQIDALCSLLYNTGPGGITGGIQRAINAHQVVDQAFMAWAHPSVLEGRRRREITLFNYGDYGDGKPAWKPETHTDPDKPPAKLPRWFWAWAEWRLGRGEYVNHGHDPKLRHRTGAPKTVPAWAFKLLDRYVKGEPIR
jgi:GH24 family phage-related lysozyme (muramidase)